MVSCMLAFMMSPLTGCNGGSSSPDNKDSSAETQSGQVDNTGKKVSVNYTGTYEDGTKFDSSYDRGQTLDFTVGSGQMISGFDNAVKTMKVGEERTVTLSPEEAYGAYDPQKVFTVDASSIIQGSPTVGSKVMVNNGAGVLQGKVTTVNGSKVTIDANSEMAGKTLIFDIKLEDVQ